MCYLPGVVPHALAIEVNWSRALATRVGAMAKALRSSGKEELACRQKSQDMGPVTEADLRANATLVQWIQHAFPEDSIIAEESDNTRVQRDTYRCWFLDPIDGTSDFAANRQCWAIHIGLCIEGQPCLGLVHEPDLGRSTFGVIDPETQKGFFWWEQHGARSDALSASATLSHPPRAVASANHRNDWVDAALARIGVLPSLTQSVGSTGVKSAIVARGEAEVYVHPSQKTRLWDSCAPQAILTAAGGCMTGIDGSAIDYRNGPMYHPAGLLATRGLDHQDTVRRLDELCRRWQATLPA